MGENAETAGCGDAGAKAAPRIGVWFVQLVACERIKESGEAKAVRQKGQAQGDVLAGQGDYTSAGRPQVFTKTCQAAASGAQALP